MMGGMNRLMLVLSLTFLAVTFCAASPALADWAPGPPEECPEGAEVGDPCGANGTCEETTCESEDGSYECIGCVEEEPRGCSVAGPVAIGSASLAILMAVPLLLWVRRR